MVTPFSPLPPLMMSCTMSLSDVTKLLTIFTR